MYFPNLDYFYGPFLICKCTHTCINSSHSPIVFYLEQLSAVVFGKQECRDMYIYLRPKASLCKYVFACVYVCVHIFLLNYRTNEAKVYVESQ